MLLGYVMRSFLLKAHLHGRLGTAAMFTGHPIMQQGFRAVPKHFLVTDFTLGYCTHTCMSDNYTKRVIKTVIFHSPFYSRSSPCTHSGKLNMNFFCFFFVYKLFWELILVSDQLYLQHDQFFEFLRWSPTQSFERNLMWRGPVVSAAERQFW